MVRVTPVPWSVATADGRTSKTNKALLLHALESSNVQLLKDTCVCIVDGNALLHVNLPPTFWTVCTCSLNCLLLCTLTLTPIINTVSKSRKASLISNRWTSNENATWFGQVHAGGRTNASCWSAFCLNGSNLHMQTRYLVKQSFSCVRSHASEIARPRV